MTRYIWRNKPCPVCGGKGKYIHPVSGKETGCDWCDGTGKVW